MVTPARLPLTVTCGASSTPGLSARSTRHASARPAWMLPLRVRAARAPSCAACAATWLVRAATAACTPSMTNKNSSGIRMTMAMMLATPCSPLPSCPSRRATGRHQRGSRRDRGGGGDRMMMTAEASGSEVLVVGRADRLRPQDGEHRPGDRDHRGDDDQDRDDLTDAVLAAVQLHDPGAGVADERLDEDRHGGRSLRSRSAGQKPAMARTRAGYRTKMMKPSSSTSSGSTIRSVAVR